MSEERIIDPDIAKAQTLPSRHYTDERVFSDIISGFSGCWHFAAHESQLAEHNVLPLDHMEHMIGEPMLLTRDEIVRCVSNVCTHRGMLVATEPCSASTLRCGYHGRTFGLDGCFRNMPEFEGVEGFPSASDDLAGFPLRRWKGLLFAGTEPRRFENCMDELGSRLGWMPIESFEHDPSRHRSYDIDANWALYVDNYLEGFHIPYVHGDLHEELDYDSYRTELFEGGVLQVGIARRGEACFELPESSPDHGQRIAAYYYWLYPGVMLNFYPWGLSVNLVIPLSVDRTRIVYHGFVWDRSKLGEGAGGDLDKVEAEDQGIVEAVQRGVAAGAYDRGRYSPTKEAGVHHFHRMLAS
jgi:choline monooxygenase